MFLVATLFFVILSIFTHTLRVGSLLIEPVSGSFSILYAAFVILSSVFAHTPALAHVLTCAYINRRFTKALYPIYFIDNSH